MDAGKRANDGGGGQSAGRASLGSRCWTRATDIRMPSASPSVTMAVPLPFIGYGGTPTTGKIPLTMPMFTKA